MRSAARSPLLSTYRPDIRDVWAKGLNAPADCEADWAESAKFMSDVTSGLSITYHDTYRVMEFQCGLGAYQGSYQYAILDKRNPEHFTVKWLTVPQYTFEEDSKSGHVITEPIISGLPTWDPKRPNHLSVFTKFRGMGDCGTLSDYQLTKDYSLELTQVKARDCDNDHMPANDDAINPARWPVVYHKK